MHKVRKIIIAIALILFGFHIAEEANLGALIVYVLGVALIYSIAKGKI